MQQAIHPAMVGMQKTANQKIALFIGLLGCIVLAVNF